MWHNGANDGVRREIGAGSALARGTKKRRDEKSTDHGKKHPFIGREGQRFRTFFQRRMRFAGHRPRDGLVNCCWLYR
jgi:hypothetical protein